MASNRYRSKAFQSAYEKGFIAGLNNAAPTDNPYPDWRTGENKVTFSRGFRRVWQRGLEAGLQERQRIESGK